MLIYNINLGQLAEWPVFNRKALGKNDSKKQYSASWGVIKHSVEAILSVSRERPMYLSKG